MRLSDLERVLVLAPHADDEVLGCGGLMAQLAEATTQVTVIYAAVDGSQHYGLDEKSTYQQRLVEIEHVAELLRFDYRILYGDRDLMERLDTVPKRELVDHYEEALDTLRPDLLLLPADGDYDQDHLAVFTTAFAAARPISMKFGKWLPPHVLTYEMTKLNWSPGPVIRPTAFVDISADIETKLESIRRYETQLRASPHIRSLEAVRALAAIRGKEIGVEYAEAFSVLRTVLG